jgi:hypothetical protein
MTCGYRVDGEVRAYLGALFFIVCVVYSGRKIVSITMSLHVILRCHHLFLCCRLNIEATTAPRIDLILVLSQPHSPQYSMILMEINRPPFKLV